MLLRRITEHVRAQNWFAVVVDFLVVVLGIFIGLQVTDWNQARLDRKTEANYLVALQADLLATEAGIQTSLDGYRVIRGALGALAAFDGEAAANRSPEELDRLIANGLWDLSVLEEQLNAYEDLKSSGRTNLLGSAPLRLGLSRLDAKIARYRVAEQDLAEVQYRSIDSYLRDSYPMRRFARVYRFADGLPAPDGVAPPDHLAFITRQDTQNRVTMKFMTIASAMAKLTACAKTVAELQQLVAERLAQLSRGPAPGAET